MKDSNRCTELPIPYDALCRWQHHVHFSTAQEVKQQTLRGYNCLTCSVIIVNR